MCIPNLYANEILTVNDKNCRHKAKKISNRINSYLNTSPTLFAYYANNQWNKFTYK